MHRQKEHLIVDSVADEWKMSVPQLVKPFCHQETLPVAHAGGADLQLDGIGNHRCY